MEQKKVIVVRLRKTVKGDPSERLLNKYYEDGYHLIAFDSVSGCGIFELEEKWPAINIDKLFTNDFGGTTHDPYPFVPSVFCGNEESTTTTAVIPGH